MSVKKSLHYQIIETKVAPLNNRVNIEFLSCIKHRVGHNADNLNVVKKI
jgi:hypothetical protein